MNENSIILALYRHYRSSLQAAAPRYTMPSWPWQADLLTVSKAGYATEYEVKISRSDFKADALKSATIWEKYDPQTRRTPHSDHRKHDLLAARDGRCPARFYYAAPAGLLSLSDIPEWSGLIELEPNRWNRWAPYVKVARPAPRLHGQKVKDELVGDMNRALAFRFWGMLSDRHYRKHATH